MLQVARSLNYDAPKQGDGHSVINTYLRKLKAEREALTVRQAPAAVTQVSQAVTAVSTVTTQTSLQSDRLLSTAAIQTDTPPYTVETTQPTAPVTQTTHTAYMSVTTPSDVRAPAATVTLQPPTTSAAHSHVTSAHSHVTSEPITLSRSAAYVPASHQVPSAAGHVTTASQSDYRFSAGSAQGRAMPPPPSYTARTQSMLTSQPPRYLGVTDLHYLVTQYAVYNNNNYDVTSHFNNYFLPLKHNV